MTRIVILLLIVFSTLLLFLMGGNIWLRQSQRADERRRAGQLTEMTTTAKSPGEAGTKFLQMTLDRQAKNNPLMGGTVKIVTIKTSVPSKGNPNLWTVKGSAGVLLTPPAGTPPQHWKTVPNRPELVSLQWETMPRWDVKRHLWHAWGVKSTWTENR